jgi:hypothetical protein
MNTYRSKVSDTEEEFVLPVDNQMQDLPPKDIMDSEESL